MYKIESFLGDKFNRINTILDYEYGIYKRSFNLIGSANFPFKSVLEALSHPINLNPAEGFPGKRYFPNCSNLDEIELYGESLIKELFKLPERMEVSLQPHSGTQANQIIYNAVLEKGDSVLIFKTDCGGHVSHSFFNKLHYNVFSYGIDKNHLIDYSELEESIRKNSPKLVIAGASSYPRQIDYERVGNICKQYGSLLLADISHSALYVLSEHHKSPVEFADFITFTTHKTTRGPRSGIIIYNKNFAKAIKKSIFPVSQGAPKFNEILAKVVMSIELTDLDLKSYATKVRFFSKSFSKAAESKGFDIYTHGSDGHLCIINLSKVKVSGADAEKRLESINIFANRNLIPKDNASPLICSGIRFGFLTLATLDFQKEDFESLTDIILEQIIFPKHINKKKVEDIAANYQYLQ